jgi:hypothetical protein
MTVLNLDVPKRLAPWLAVATPPPLKTDAHKPIL